MWQSKNLVALCAALLFAPVSATCGELAQWVNVGSNTGLFGYDWKTAGVAGLNLAGSPQSMRRDVEKLKARRSEIADGAYVIFTLCPFTSVLPESYDKTPSRTTHPLLSFDGTPSQEKFASSCDNLISVWKRQFSIGAFSDPMTAKNRAAYAEMVKFAREAIAWCRAERLNPVFVYPPASKCFDGVFPEDFFRAYVLDFVRDVAPDVPFFDYRSAPELRDDRNYADALFLNRTGCARLTERTVRDVRIAALRKELRAFYPEYGQFSGPVKDPRQKASCDRIEDDLRGYMAAHPDYDALDLRRETYLLMRRHFVPFLFKNSPFYFEAGINGGWSGCCPARLVNKYCQKFYKEKGLIPQEAFDRLYGRMGERLLVCCGPFSDDMHHLPPFHTILTKGFSGVRKDVASALAACPADDPLGKKELETALVGLDTIHEIQLKFHEAAKGLGDARMVEASARCPWEPPRTFYEGLNALWFIREILAYVDGLDQFALGRPDAWLIGFYRKEIAAGTLTEREARELVAKFLVTADCHLDTMAQIRDDRQNDETEIPLTLGGCDEDGKRTYNELTAMFLDEHLANDCVYPKLHCRISRDDPEDYLRKIGEMLLKNHAVFALFNDDRHIPQFVGMGYPLDRARDYVGTGCWDGNVDSLTDVDCANYISVGRILEMTLHPDPTLQERLGLRIDPIDGAKSYEEVRDTVYRNFIRFFRSVLSDYTRYGRANAKVFPHPVYSMCLQGGLETRRDTTDGGVAFRPREVTLAFLANVVDSLCAIRKVCFEDRIYTLDELLQAVRTNWAGAKGGRIRRAVLNAPYWGDNSKPSNDLMKWWIDSVASDIDGLKSDQGRSYVLATWIYREFKHWGEKTKATPDGRHDGDRMAQGFSPSEFRCEVGATEVLNAIGSLDHTKLYASNANLAFDKTVMRSELFEAIFRVCCQYGMHLLQPNCLSIEELEDAKVHPENHRDLIVKVCGFSARFIALSPKWQDEVIARHRLGACGIISRGHKGDL